MIARRESDDAARQVGLWDGQQEICRSSNFERSAALKVLAFEEALEARGFVEQPGGENRRAVRKGFDAIGRGLNVVECNH
jgi:hypothetical protein